MDGCSKVGTGKEEGGDAVRLGVATSKFLPFWRVLRINVGVC